MNVKHNSTPLKKHDSYTYDPAALAKKWSKTWRENRVYEPSIPSNQLPNQKTTGIKQFGDPFYNLMMFPYPSAEGLHVGNMYAFSGADIFGRYQRMLGKDVFEPIGLDGFGIHSENYAIKVRKHPVEQAKISEKNFYRQLEAIGNGFSWEERLETYDPAYYKWTQWLFVQMYKNGLAYKANANVHWCPSCKTVLADEQVEDGKCERCTSEVERKSAKQWFFKITSYADKLLHNIEKLDWPEKIKIAQQQWIGKKEGVLIRWSIRGLAETLEIFTTRLETIYGATFLVVCPDHPILQSMSLPSNVKEYIRGSLQKTEQQRKIEEKERTGEDTGYKAINPITKKAIPIWVADFVLSHYATGAIMGVPAHDYRDHDFAIEHTLSRKQVVECTKEHLYKKPWKVFDVKKHLSDDEKCREINKEVALGALCYSGDGNMINSSTKYNGKTDQEVRKLLVDDYPEIINLKTTYHLRDWLISRQRFWGPPIPMVECAHCGWQAIPEDQLPVELPYIQDYKPTEDGKSPLEKAPKSWLYRPCPKCGKKAKRETDVSDTFLDSSWYFLRYPSLHSKTADAKPFDPETTRRWLPVNAYIGGAEHAVLHLLYSRFITMALHDWGYLDFEEPFPFLFGHGLIIKDGAKMSKSRGNVVNPDEYIEKFGADALRTYLMFLGPYNQGGDFRDTGIAGMYRWFQRVWYAVVDRISQNKPTTPFIQKKLHQTIKKCTKDIANFRFNTAIAALMECVNVWYQKGESMQIEDAFKFLKLLAPFAPYMTEELYHTIILPQLPQDEKNSNHHPSSMHQTSWPNYDKDLIVESEKEIVVQINGKVRSKLFVSLKDANKRDLLVSLAKEDNKIRKLLEEKTVKKTIVVPEKLINFVI